MFDVWVVLFVVVLVGQMWIMMMDNGFGIFVGNQVDIFCFFFIIKKEGIGVGLVFVCQIICGYDGDFIFVQFILGMIWFEGVMFFVLVD